MQIDPESRHKWFPDALNTEYMVEVGVGQNYGLEP